MTDTLGSATHSPPTAAAADPARGVSVSRRYTRAGINPLDEVRWDRRQTVITNPDGSVVFRMDDVEVPEAWSQLATDIVVSKYFRKAGVPGEPGHETSVRQVVRRIAHTLRVAGEEQGGAFGSPEDAEAFEAELSFMLVHQIGAFNSPVWFNCGLWHEYGILGSGGNFYWDPATKAVKTTEDSYSRPQVSACFIQSVGDDLMSIFELAKNEARVFKFGSGTGSNFSQLRGRMEKLSGGGTSSGLMSFLEVLDRGAGATKSGGTTRRAAKMVVLDMDHPEIVDFVRWKVREEKKVAALVAAGFSSDFNGEAYGTVSGQNSNNSVRVSDTFMKAVIEDGTWSTTFRTTGQVHETHKARDLWRTVAEAAWQCADPGVQYDDTIQRWHTSKATGRINATNPCVTGETLVATSDGWRRIDELVGTNPEVVGKDGVRSRASRVIATGVKRVFRLRTISGYEFRVTADHKVWTTNRGDVAVRDLTRSDCVVLGGAGFGSRKLSSPLAMELGSSLKLFARSNGESLTPRATATLEETEGLSSEVLELDRASSVAFLRGVFSKGATVNQGDLALHLPGASARVAQEIQLLLLNFGIRSTLGRGELSHVGVPGNLSVRSPLSIQGSSCLRFQEEIGFELTSSEASELSDLCARVAKLPDELTDEIESIVEDGEEEVFDLTEPVTSHFVANGIVVHNCSEFAFLDDTACNLASINLMKFLRPDDSFDVEGYRHANRVFFLAQEIAVSLASYPTERIAQRSEEYRPLGLGYANLGTLLMVNGLPYDSDSARAYSACITAIMTGEAYALSAEMAAARGPFLGFEANRTSMNDVMRLHRDAARAIDPAFAPRDLRAAAIESWDRAYAFGSLHGYRNAQATVLAPTGTIGLLMDCDTTGVEPDFALVKFKKLAGGGYFKIVNQSVPRALRRLGYDDPAVERIVRFAVGTGTLEGSPHINRSSLQHKGLHADEVDRIEKALPTMLDIRFAFTRGMLTDDTLTRLGVSQAEREKPTFTALPFLGYTDQQIEAANLYVCGTQTVEGAPGLKTEHLAVFDCANRCGAHSTRYIEPMGHVRMMGAVQPFISGAISKTVNLPHESTVEEVEKIYFESWRLGLKAVALYRDGSKMSQPLATSKKADEPAAGTGPKKLQRRRLPTFRHGFTQEARLGGHKIFLRTGEYEDGTIGEIFIDMHKEGAAFRSIMNCFAISVSMGLQYGVPLNDLVDQFCFTRFEPNGRVDGHSNIRVGTSVIDYVFRVLGYEYLDRTDLVHVVDENMQGHVKAMDVPVGHEHRGHRSKARETAANGHTEIGEVAGETAAAGRMTVNPAESGQQAQARKFTGDAPLCSSCGHITVRNATCYRCLNCGTSLGCS